RRGPRGVPGDIAVVAPTAAYRFDVEDFLRDWLKELWVEQRAAAGRVPFLIPDPLKDMERPRDVPTPASPALWSGAAVWVPWALWQAYGNSFVLAHQFESMAAHLRRVESLLSPTGLLDQGVQFGHLVDPNTPPRE